MKIVSLLGSPRSKGNSATLTARFLDTARELGAEVESFELNKLNFKGCQACYVCKTKQEKCAVEDDLAPVLDAVADCDVLVLATPIYYGEVTAQMKAFIDRTFCYVKPDYMTNPVPSRLAPGKKSVWIIPQQSPKEAEFNDVYPRYDFFFQWYGFENHLIRALGVHEAGAVREHEDIMKEAENLARELMA